MRSIARHIQPLARLGREGKSCSCVTHTQRQRIRKFHNTRQLLSESRGPSGQNDHNSFERRTDEQDIHKPTLSTSERASGTAEPQSTTESSSGRRTIRQRRNALETPKPPPIPDWFLKHNVHFWDSSPSSDLSSNIAEVVHFTDHKTGRSLFRVPTYWIDVDANGRLSLQLPKESGDVSRNKDVRSLKKAESSECDDGVKPDSQVVDPGFFTSEIAAKASGRGKYRLFEDFATPYILCTNGIYHAFDSLWYVFLEVEASAQAAFTLVGREQRASSYAASNIDLSLLCPDSESHAYLDIFVEGLAHVLGADLIRLDANDFADLTDEYVGNGIESPGWFSTLGYDVFDGLVSGASPAASPNKEELDDADDEDNRKSSGPDNESSINLENIRKLLYDKRHELAKALDGVPIQHVVLDLGNDLKTAKSQDHSQSATQSSHTLGSDVGDPVRLRVLLDNLLEAPSQVRYGNSSNENPDLAARVKHIGGFRGTSGVAATNLMRMRDLLMPPGLWPTLASSRLLMNHLPRAWTTSKKEKITLLDKSIETTLPATPTRSRKTIIHVRDLSDICKTPVGTSIARQLIRVIQKRRKLGEEILLVGTSAQDIIGPVSNGQEETDDLPLRHLVLPPFLKPNVHPDDKLDITKRKTPLQWASHRIFEINLRHIQSALHRVRPTGNLDLFSETSQLQLKLLGSAFLGERVLSLEHVQRIVLMAIGLSRSHMISEIVDTAHVAVSTAIIDRIDDSIQAWSDLNMNSLEKEAPERTEPKDLPSRQFHTRMEELKKSCNQHEGRLLSGVADPENIKTGFSEVHAPPETIDALKTVTSLSLLRPDAFKYGVLAKDRLNGLMLYGPPGTGKTLLAKAVAKDARATVLEISGAQIYEKYVGEGEKMVRAVFTLAKKLSPCIVFLDEADALFARRGESHRSTHRQIINQFLREWDGMDSHEVFIMVASNRPFDLDDAVLRRLPRRLLVDLPVAKDRESILGIHLKDEHLDESVSLSGLAEKTPFYSGSDLKNLCVAAALACVKEENEGMANANPDGDFKFPEKRTLSSRHFDQAIKEISASVSEDMSSLAAIRKFDELYGDRRGRRKKVGYGFDLGGEDKLDEDAVRVRKSDAPSPP